MLSNSTGLFYATRASRKDLTGRVLPAFHMTSVQIHRRNAILLYRRGSKYSNVCAGAFAGLLNGFHDRRNYRVKSANFYNDVSNCAHRKTRDDRTKRISGDAYLLLRRQFRRSLYERCNANRIWFRRPLRLFCLRVRRDTHKHSNNAQRVSTNYVRRNVCTTVNFRSIDRILFRRFAIRRINYRRRNFSAIYLSFISSNISCLYFTAWSCRFHSFFHRVGDSDFPRCSHSTNCCCCFIFSIRWILRGIVC